MNKTFSAQMLKTYMECPYKYYLEYEKKIKIPQDVSFADTGKNLHALINYYFKGFDVSKLEKALSDDEKTLWANFLNAKIDRNNIFKSEYGFNVKIKDDNWLTGRIDAITKEDNTYTIYDWKTGKLPENPEKDIQTIVYLFALDKILQKRNFSGEKPILRFVYMDLKTSETKAVFIQNETLNPSIETIYAIIKESQEFSETNYCSKNNNLQNSCSNGIKNTSCKTCKFNSICKTDVFL